MSRSFHTIEKKTCNDVNCVNYGESWQTEGPVPMAFNIYNGKTSKSGIFPTPGIAGAQFTDYYISPTSNPDPSVFMTSLFNPVVTDLFVNPLDLAKAAVWLFTSFTTTDLEGNTREWLHNGVGPQGGYIISIEQPGQGTTLPNKSTDVPLPTLTGFMFGSWDKMLMEIFNKSFTSFQVLTNPNEIGGQGPNKVQIIWPEGIEWSLSFVLPQDDAGDNLLFTYTSSPPMLTYITVDSDLNPTSTIAVIVGSGEVTTFSVFDEPTGYVTCRQPFDLTWPPYPYVCFNGFTGVTGFTGAVASAKACLVKLEIDNSNIPIDSACLCIPFIVEDQTISPVGSRVNGTKLVAMLNAMFFKSRVTGWRAVEDIFYPYFRIIHPNHILSYTITLRKYFYRSDGTRNSCFDEMQLYKQGALTVYIKNSSVDGSTLITTNSTDILDGISWCAQTDLAGCFS